MNVPIAFSHQRDNKLDGLCQFPFIGARLTAYRDRQVVAQRDVKGSDVSSAVLEMAESQPNALILIDAVTHQQPVATAEFKNLFTNSARGLVGIRVGYEELFHEVHASEMVATNFDFIDVVQRFIAEVDLSPDVAIRELKFECIHSRMFAFRHNDEVLTELYRGALPPKTTPPSRAEISDMAASLASWFVRNMTAEGELPYKTFANGRPVARGQNNTIRQFMATVCIHRYAEHVNDRCLIEHAKRNLTFNLKRFYCQHDEIGVIAFNGSAKLGASAMAALAIYEQEGRNGEHSEQLSMLLSGIDRLWCKDGSFRTFHFPTDRNDNQNFYPGETLCLWARLIQHERDPRLIGRFMSSFLFYREWHLNNRNPAFVPWHTIACYSVWEVTKDTRLRDFILEMNEWLLHMQQSNTIILDFEGRFFSPARPDFGPPHTSSTGVYVDGLTFAYQLALLENVECLAKRFEHAIMSGIRSVQCSLINISDPLLGYVYSLQAAGGVKTNPYDQLIRVDNVQHALAAVTAYLHFSDSHH